LYVRNIRKILDTLEPTVETVLKIEMLKAEVDYRIDWLEKTI